MTGLKVWDQTSGTPATFNCEAMSVRSATPTPKTAWSFDRYTGALQQSWDHRADQHSISREESTTFFPGADRWVCGDRMKVPV